MTSDSSFPPSLRHLLLGRALCCFLACLVWFGSSTQSAEPQEYIGETLLQNVDDRTSIDLYAFRYNRATRTYFGRATITNTSSEPLAKPMYLVVNGITPDSVSVVNHHGDTVSGKPYYDLSSLIEAGTLAAGSTTGELTLEMANPEAVQFQMDLSVYIVGAAPSNIPPIITSAPITTATEEILYEYHVEATDANNDHLLYILTAFPEGMTIDTSTGLIGWTPTNEQANKTHSVTVQVSDGKDQVAQSFEISVINVNDVPVANAGGPYSGEAGNVIAFDGSGSGDVDGDALSCTWTFGDGSSGTGLNPTHVYAAAGIYTVRLTVDDGNGGTDTDETTATITGYPSIQVVPMDISFGNVYIDSPKDEYLTVSNMGTDTLSVSSITSDNQVFSVPQAQAFSIEVGGDPVTVPIRFTPDVEGLHSGVISITSNDPNAGTVSVSVSGYGELPLGPPDMAVSPDQIGFGDVFMSSFKDLELTVSNSGEGPLIVSGIASDNPDFSVMPPVAFDISPTGTPRRVPIRYTPSALGSSSGNITIASNDPDSPQVVMPVSGNGVQSVQPPDISVSPSTLDFGNIFVGSTSLGDISIANEGEGILTVTDAALDNDSVTEYEVLTPLPITVSPDKAPVNIEVSYKPTSSGPVPKTNLVIHSDDPDESQFAVPLLGNGVDPPEVTEGVPDPPLNAQVIPTDGLNSQNVITAQSQFDVHVLVTFKEPADSISVVVDLIDATGSQVSSSSLNVPGGQQTVIVTGIDASSLLDGPIAVQATASNSFGDSSPGVGEQAVKRTSTLPPPVVDPIDPVTTQLSVHITGTSQEGTLVKVEGGASVGTQQLASGETGFDILVPLRQNSDNTLVVSASDGVDTASADPFTIAQIVPSGLVIAKAEARPLTVEETIELVEKGVIDLDDPENFNVSMFTIVANVGGKETPPITITQPVVIPQEPGISFGTSNWIMVKDEGGAPLPKPGEPQISYFPAEIFVIRTPGGEVIPGVIIIDGRIKTLKEFFQVTIYIMNTSERFTLADVVAKLAPKAGLTPIRVGLGTDVSDVNLGNAVDTIELGDIPPQSDTTGQFIVRGDQVGVHEVTVNFTGAFVGDILPEPVPVSGSARTTLSVLGPPRLDVVVKHPPTVEKDEIYTVEVDITNRSQATALYSSLEINLGGGVQLLDASNNPISPPAIVSLGHISPGQTVHNSFRARALVQGSILSCQGVASENLQLTVSIGVSCPIGYIPAAYEIPEEDAPPTLLSIGPKNNAVDVSVDTTVTAILTGQATNITNDQFTSFVIDPEDSVRLLSARFVSGGTFYLEELSSDGKALCRIPTDLVVTPGVDNDATIAVLRPGTGPGTGVGELSYRLKGNTKYRATLVGGENGIQNASSGAPFGSTYTWSFRTELVDDMIPPAVVNVSPQSNQQDVGLNANVLVTFSEPMEVSSFRAYTDTPMNSTFGIFDNGSLIGGTVRFNTELTQVTFTPGQSLQAGRTYTVRITTGVTDKFGHSLENTFTSSFSTIPADVTPPDAPIVDPVPGLTNLATLFVTGNCEPGAEVWISGGISLAKARAGGTGAFSVPVPLMANAIHNLTAMAVDASGNASPQVSVDRYGNPLTVRRDGVKPKLAAINILPNTVDVPLDAIVSMSFTEDIGADSVNSLNFNLIGEGKLTPGTFSMSGTDGLVFTPDGDLATSTVYTIRLRKGGIRDMAGNGLDQEYTIQFRTTLAPPSLSYINPDSGYQGRVVDAVISGANLAEVSISFDDSSIVAQILPGSTATKLLVRIYIGDFAPVGVHYFTISTPMGEVRSQDVGVGFSVLEAPPPDIVTVEPDSGIPGDTLIVDLRGANFRSGFDITFGPDIQVEQPNYVSSQWIQARIYIPMTASVGPRTITVTNIDGKTDTAAFSVQSIPEPVLTSVSPASGIQGISMNAIINGQYLREATPSISGGMGISLLDSTSIQLLVDISIGSSIQTGKYDLFVTTSGGTSNSLTFTVLDDDPSADADSDGMTDNYELANGLDPHNPDDADQDPDGDGLTNVEEFGYGSSPFKADTDGDGVDDPSEVAMGTDPAKADDFNNLVIDGRTVTLKGTRNFASLTIVNGGVLTHPPATETETCKLVLNVSGTLTIDHISMIDVSSKGFLGGGHTGELRGRTLGNTVNGGSGEDAGGSCGGLGGGDSNLAYGDMMNPNQPGSGGGGRSGVGSGGSGGGLVAIAAHRIVLNGSIEANGESVDSGGGGSGGGINLNVNTLTGDGRISAKGGSGISGGGGGRVAIRHRDISGFNVNNVDISGGAGSEGNGGAGTAYMKGVDQQYGDLLVDNSGLETIRFSTPLRSIGSGSVGSLTSTLLMDPNASFPLPDSSTGALGLVGLRLNPNVQQCRVFPVMHNDSTSITIDSSAGDMTSIADLGDTYGGEYMLDRVTVRGAARVSTEDNFFVLGNLTVTSDSQLVGRVVKLTPYIRSLSTYQGPIGGGVTILGEGFSTSPAENEVDFNGALGTVMSAGPTNLSVRITAGASSGNLTVTVMGRGSNPVIFSIISEGNIVPSITSSPVTTAREGVLYVYDVEAQDANNDILQFSLDQKPDGMTIEPITGEINWTPSSVQSGTHEVRVVVDDGRGGIASQTYTITVEEAVNNAPVITSQPGTLAGTEGQEYVYNVNADDADNDTLAFSLTKYPSGMQIQGDTGLMTWTPSADQSGSHAVTVRVSDGRGGADTQSFTLQIQEALNVAPVITSTPPTVVTEMDTYTYDVEATDGDNDDLSYSLPSSPAGMDIDPDTGFIMWTPAHEQLGDHEVTVNVDDGRDGIGSQTFTITVKEINQPPEIISSPVTTGQEGVEYSYDVEATDPNAGDILSFSLAENPEGMTIDSSTGIISWIPSGTQAGTHNVTVEVTDQEGASYSQSFPIQVAEAVNNPPVITSTPYTIASEGQVYSYQVTATDADNDELAFSLTESPAGMTIDDESTGLVTWTPLSTQVGDHSVVVTVDDSRGGTDSQSFIVAVTAIPPDFTFTEDTFIGGSNTYYEGKNLAVENAMLTIQGIHQFSSLFLKNCAIVIAEDLELATLTLLDSSVLTHPGTTTTTESRLVLTVDTLTVDSTSEIDVNGKGYGPNSGPGAGNYGYISGTYGGSGAGHGGKGGDNTWNSIADGGNAYGSMTEPTLPGSGGGLSLNNRGGSGGGVVNVNVSGVMTVDGSITADGTGEPNVVAPSYGGGSGGSIYIRTGTFTGSGLIAANGGITRGGGGAGGRIAIYYTENTYEGAIEAHGGSGVQAGGAGTIYMKSPAQSYGDLIVDNGGLSGADTPLRSIASGTITELAGHALTDASANFPVPDPSTGNLGLIGLELNPNIRQSKIFTIIDNDATTITINPDDGDMTQVAQIGNTYTSENSFDDVSVKGRAKVSTGADIIVYGNLSVDADSSLLANSVIQPPYIRSLSLNSGVPGDSITFYGLGFSSIPEENAVTFNGLPATVSSASPTELTVTVPDGATDGPIVVTVGGSITNQMDFAVGPNIAPTIVSSPPPAVLVNELYTYDVDAQDSNNDTLEYILITSPEGMTINPVNGLISWTPTEAQTGAHDVTVKVEDGRGGSDTQTFTITVEVNLPPQITSSPNTEGQEEVEYSYDVEADDPNLIETLTFELVVKPEGMGIDPATGLITWTPSLIQAGAHDVTVKVTDSRGESDSQSFIINVAEAVNVPPDIISEPTALARVGVPCEALYLMDDASDTIIHDFSGNNHHGSIFGAVGVSDTPSYYQVNAALSFDGLDDYVNLGTEISAEIPDAFTISAWIKIPSGESVIDPLRYAIVSSYDYIRDGTPARDWRGFIFRIVENRLYFAVFNLLGANSGGYDLVQGMTDLNDGEWHHVAAVAPNDGVNRVDVLVDGVLDSEYRSESGPCDYDYSHIEMNIGRLTPNNMNEPMHYLKGLIDEVAIYSRMLTPDEILYNARHSLYDSVYTYDVDATDGDGDELTYSLTVAPDGMGIDPSTGLIAWIPSDTQVGTHDVTVKVSDGRGGEITQSFTIQVEGVTSFTEVAAIAGVECGGYSRGVAWGDYDNDGDLDIYVGNFEGASKLYRNNGDGVFTEVSSVAGVADTSKTRGVAWGDYDSDGYIDLYTVNSYSANRLYLNNGDGTFTDVASSSGVNDSGGDGNDLAFGDYDSDGDIDLYVTNGWEPNRLYRDNGDGTFTDVAAIAGVDDIGNGHSAAWADYDSDGDLDIYVGNSQSANRLYRNNGDGTSTDVAPTVGVNDGSKSQGFAWGDYDNDGDLDIYLANNGQANRLYNNNGDGTFTDVASIAGVDSGERDAGTAFWDYDNDGDLDIYLASYSFPNRLYRNNGDGTFTDVAAAAGIDIDGADGDHEGVAYGDYDNDGDLDLYVTSNRVNRLYRNNLNNSDFLFVRPLDAEGRYNRHGSIVRIFGAGTHTFIAMQTIDGSNGLWSQSSYDAHFGLDANGIYDIEITFPGGVVIDKNIDPALGDISPSNLPPGHMIEIRQSINSPPSITSSPVTTTIAHAELAALYLFDESSGTTAYDSGGNNNDGSIFGAAYTTDAPFGYLGNSALSFDGVDDYINCGSGESFHVPENSTFEAWVKTSNGANSAGYINFAYWNDYYNHFEFMPGIGADDGKVESWAYSRLGNVRDDFVVMDASYDYRDGEWHHFAVVFKTGEAAGYVYIDGEYFGSDTFNFADWANALHRSPFIIGRSNHYYAHGSEDYYYFNGLIDEVAIYSRALTPEEIAYDATHSLSEPVTIIYVYRVNATDPDGDALTYSLIQAPEGMTIDPDSGLISWTPSEAQTGEHNVVVEVSDGKGGTATQSFTVTVQGLNSPPTITSSPVTTATAHTQYDALYLLDEGSGSTAFDSSANAYDGSITGASYTTDTPFSYDGNSALSFDGVDDYVDLPQLSYAVGCVEMWVRHDWTPDGTGQISWTNGDSDVKPSFNIFLGNVSGSVTGEVLTVLSENEIGVAMWTAYGSSDLGNPSPDEWHHVVIIRGETYGKLYFDGKEVTTSIGSSISGGPFATSTSNSYPLFADGACHYLGKRANELSYFNGLIDEVAIYSRALTPEEIAYDATHSLSEPVTIIYVYDVYATDPDGDTLTYSLIQAPEGMMIDPDTGLINWTPSETQVGEYSVVVEVSDGKGGTATQSFTVTVQGINNPPTIISTPVTTATESVLYTYDVDATDPDGDTLTYALITSPSSMTIDENTGLITWTPAVDQVGSHSVTVEVSDNKGGKAVQSFTIEVVGEKAFTEVASIAGVDDIGYTGGVAWGDYDGDGDLDLYLANADSENRLYRNDGNGAFTEVAAYAGVNDVENSLSAGWGDYNNDGLLDLYLVKPGSANRLYRNNGDDTFTDVGHIAGLDDTGYGEGFAWGDYDGDGDIDIYIANYDSVNRLYQNNGDGTFTDVATSAGVGDTAIAVGVAWGDYDSDGDLDLYTTNDGTNRLYRNNGDGIFTDVAASAGVDDSGSARGVAWGDYDNDGDLDIYLANNNSPNRLYQNNGNGTFTDIGGSAGVDDSGHGTGVAFADFDHDGDLDIYMAKADGANRLYKNNGDGTFTDVAASAGVDDPGSARGVAWGDYDNDGDLDIYLANTDGANRLYQNNQSDSNYLFVRPVDADGRFNRHGAIVRVFEAGTTNLVGMRTIDGGSSYMSQNAYDAHFGLDATGSYDIEVTFPGGIVANKDTDPTLGNIIPGNLPQGHLIEVRQPVAAFTEVASSAGVDDVAGGHGAAWGDYDNDGDMDIYLSNWDTANRLYLSNGDGTFTDVAFATGVDDLDSGDSVIWGDYDNDGDLDLYLVNWDSGNRLYQNNGDGTFTDVAAGAGVDDVASRHGAAWGDYDGDGDLDLYLANVGANRLYQNNGDGTFTDVAFTAGVDDASSGDAVAWADYDSDGGLDIYLVNRDSANRLYQNNGDGTFTDVALLAGVDDSGSGRGVAWGDYDDDGDLDLYISNWGSANRLYRNNGDGMFTDVAVSAGVDDIGNGEGVVWCDYDNNGDLDLYLVNDGSANRLYRNNADGTFTDLAYNYGLDDQERGIGVASCDYDNDGDLDLYLVNFDSANRLYQNNTNNSDFLFVRPLDSEGWFNRHGAIVRVFEAGTTTLIGMSTIDGGSSYLSQNAYDAHFGLDANSAYDIEVVFPGGVVVDKNVDPTLGNVIPANLPPGHLIEVRQPSLNRPPVITSVPPPSGREGEEYRCDVDATDPDGDPVTYKLIKWPSGMSIDEVTGLITWTPAGDQSGLHEVSVEASDDKGEGTVLSFSIDIEEAINMPPVITSEPIITASEGELYTYQVEVFDADGDSLLIFMTESPAEMSMSDTGAITWVPSSTDGGPHNVTVVVSDGRGGSDEQGFTIQVEDTINNPPVITSTPPTLATLGILYTYQVQAEDVDGDQLEYTLNAGAFGMVIDANNGLISWIPSSTTSQFVSLTVSDSREGAATQEFTIEINTPPTVTSAPIETATEGVLYAYDVNVEDADGDAVIFTLMIFPPGMTIDEGTGVINWTPSATQAGQHIVIIQVEDGRGGVTSQDFIITVAEALNVSPEIISQPPISANNNSLYVYDVEAFDADGDPLSFSLTASPSGMTITAETGIINWTPIISQVGSHSVVVEVSDGRGGLATQSFSITVIEFNHIPLITSEPITQATEGVLYTYDLQAVDSDGDTLTFALTASPTGMMINPDDGFISWTPDSSQSGSYHVVAEVTDGRGGRAVQSFVIEVIEAINTAPQITSTPVTAAIVGLIYIYEVKASDPDGDVLGYALTQSPAGMTIEANTGVITWTPTVIQEGEHQVCVEVSDKRGGSNTQTFTITVVRVLTLVIAEVNGPYADGVFSYSYQISNDPTSSAAVFDIFLYVQAPIMDIQVPTGWDYISDFETFVEFFATVPAYDIPPGSILSGFYLQSYSGSGATSYESLDANLDRVSSQTPGPVLGR